MYVALNFRNSFGLMPKLDVSASKPANEVFEAVRSILQKRQEAQIENNFRSEVDFFNTFAEMPRIDSIEFFVEVPKRILVELP